MYYMKKVFFQRKVLRRRGFNYLKSIWVMKTLKFFEKWNFKLFALSEKPLKLSLQGSFYEKLIGFRSQN